MWYSPISCSICFLVGGLVSILSKPQNIRKLNPDLISPAFYRAFTWFPWLAYFVRQEKHFEVTIGRDYVSYNTLITIYLLLLTLISLL